MAKTAYSTAMATKKTVQNQPIPGQEARQVENNAGGFVYTVGPFEMLERFLVLGTDKPTYYSTSPKLTKDNANNIRICLKEDWKRTIDVIVSFSVSGRANKNDPALFALAVAATPEFGSPQAAQYALSQLDKVARIGTHLFHFTEYLNSMRGWGRSVKAAVGNWYTDKNEGQLAYSLAKYQSRDGWSNRDLLRLAHTKSNDPRKTALFAWSVAGGLDALKKASETWGEGSKKADAAQIETRRQRYADAYTLLSGETGNRLIVAYEKAKSATSADEVARLIREAGLSREMVPTQFLNDVIVWEALLEKMPMEAMVRNLGKMSSVGLLKPLSNASKFVVSQLENVDQLRKSRIHPLKLMLANGTYRQGHGRLGSNSWTVVPNIVDAVEAAFYTAFVNVVATGKSIYIAQDVSGSMSGEFSAGSGISCAMAGAALGLVIAKTESNYCIYGFTAGTGRLNGYGGGRSSGMVDLGITANDTLESATAKAQKSNWGGTDCSLPFRHAGEAGIEADAFVVITDNDTWAGDTHASQALVNYRKARNNFGVRQIVMAMTPTPFTIADPNDPFSLDVVGFDAAVPALIADFIRGESVTATGDEGEE